jgi:hypothetical protein
MIHVHILSNRPIFSPSQIGKIAIVLLMVIELFKKNTHGFNCCIFVCLYAFIVEFFCYIYYATNFYGFMFGLVNLLKIIYLISIFFFLKIKIKNIEMTFDILVTYILNMALLYSVIQLLTTVLGINVQTYGSDNGIAGGSRGIFASGNGLSLFFGFMTSIALYKYKSDKNKKYLLYFFMLFISCVLVGTKASIIFSIFNFAFLFYCIKLHYKIFIIILLLITGTYLLNLFSQIFEMIIYRFQNKQNIMTFLASSRDQRRINAFNSYDIDGLNSLRIFFGAGAFASFRSLLKDMIANTPSTERDFYDIFFNYGIVGLLFFFVYIVKNTLIFLKHRYYFFLLVFALIVLYSMLAGHVVFDAMSGLGLIIIPVICYSLNIKNNRLRE